MDDILSPDQRLQNLTDLAQAIKFDPRKPLRYYIILVNELEQRGKCAIYEKQFEEAFVNLVRMLLVIISYIPKHSDYEILDQKIRKNLATLKERYFSLTSKVKELLKKTYENEYESHKNEYLQKEKLTHTIESKFTNDSVVNDSVNELISFQNDILDENKPKLDQYLSNKSLDTQQTQSLPTSKIAVNSDDNMSYNRINSCISNISYKDIIGCFDDLTLQDIEQTNNCRTKQSSSSLIKRNKITNNQIPPNNIHNIRQSSNDEILMDTSLEMYNKLNENEKEKEKYRLNSISSPLPELESFSSSKSGGDSSFCNNYKSTSQTFPHDGLMIDFFDRTTDTPKNYIVDRSLKPKNHEISYIMDHMTYTTTKSNNNQTLLDKTNILGNCSRNNVTVSTIFDNTVESNHMSSSSVIVPGDTIERFTFESLDDINNNIETLGILGGIYTNDNYLVTHILIPKQHGTSDSCEMLNENKIFQYQIQNNLLTLGWIHTHPTQSCFLSSVDIHTHYSYQCQLEHAIAIVVAHKRNCNYIFNLTSHGMDTIRNCDQRGFHPHGPNIFQICPFAITDYSKKIKIINMRKI